MGRKLEMQTQIVLNLPIVGKGDLNWEEKKDFGDKFDLPRGAESRGRNDKRRRNYTWRGGERAGREWGLLDGFGRDRTTAYLDAKGKGTGDGGGL